MTSALTRKTPQAAAGVECPCGCGRVGVLTKKRCEKCGGTGGFWTAGTGATINGALPPSYWHACEARCSYGYAFGHVRGCACASHRAKRNRSKGQAGQRKMYRALGGTGPTPQHEGHSPTQWIPVRPESKVGAQVPATLGKLLNLATVEHWLRQNELEIPVGAGCYRSVCFDHRWLLVDLKARR